MPENLSAVECKELGIDFLCSRMDNEELRFRIIDEKGWGYILTKMPETVCGWQNSHYHKGISETYIVQKGWIGFAELLPNGEITMKVYRKNDQFSTLPGHAHNVYMAAGAITHTVKHGNCSLVNDWFESPELDTKTKSLSEDEIFLLAGIPK
jgi:hypothetical protein